jgi:hypothetical protein
MRPAAAGISTKMDLPPRNTLPIRAANWDGFSTGYFFNCPWHESSSITESK